MAMELAEGFTIILVFIIKIYAPTQTDIKHKNPNSTNSPEPNKLFHIYNTIFTLHVSAHRRKNTLRGLYVSMNLNMIIL